MLTERLLLRRWTPADCEPFAEINADPEVMRYFPALLDRAGSDALIDRIEAGFERNGFGIWAVERRAHPGLIGFVGLSVPGFAAHFTPCVEVAWRLARSAWGNGFASEAARHVVGRGFDEFGLSEIVALAVSTNAASIAVMRRIGMQHDPKDDFDHPSIAPGHPLQRHVLYRLSKEPS